MGLFDLFFDEFIEVIDWVERDKEMVMWKFPDRDADIKNGANLTVRESQQALFIDEGQAADLFTPGRYELITRNLPILTTLRNWDKNFNSPFKCDIYFFSTRIFTDLKWGTPNPIILRDPQFKQVRVKAFGTYFIRVDDPEKLFKEYAGTKTSLRISEIEDSLRSIVAPKFAEALAESGISVMDLVANYSELGDTIAPIVQEDLSPLGLELVKFQITSTTLPKEVEAFYDKMTNMNMVDDMQKFQQFQQVQAIEKAAENPSGGAGEGVGIGIGMGMAKMMMDQGEGKKGEEVERVEGGPKAITREEILSTLKDLGGLKEAGIISEAEFDAKKKELLARL